MRQIAVWITARFHRAVLVIAALFPVLPVLSGATTVLTVLARGLREGVAAALLASVLLVAAVALMQDFQMSLVWYLALVQGGSLAAVWLLVSTRSLTLTAQALAVLMLLGVGVFYAQVDDVGGFWRPFLEQFAGNIAEAGGMAMDASAFVATAQVLITGLAFGMTWVGTMLVILLGYALYALLPEREPVFGRFRELNLGRTLALATAVISVAATLSSSPWLVNSALALLVAFVLQGLALVHGLFVARQWPPALLIVIYVLAILPSPVSGAVIGMLSLGGYLDAWIDIRRRVPVVSGQE
ncbi:YybS family protein [Lentisalinibacter sediminis]|uniref:hypothetical protein n=1 Tax=Lentisalinibacter sediminis TaxID=2992237 RepID=UPI00386EFBA9